MKKIHQKMDSLRLTRDKNFPLYRYRSVSIPKHAKQTINLKDPLLRPFYHLQATTLPNSKDFPTTKYFPRQRLLPTDYHSSQLFSKKRSKEKSCSLSKSKQLQSQQKFSKNKKLISSKHHLTKPQKHSKDKSEKSKQTKYAKQSSTNQYSQEKYSKTHRQTLSRQRHSLGKKSKKSKGIQWQQILQSYGQYLKVEQIAEIKEIKTIYFLGKIKQRKHKQDCFINKKLLLSDRKHNCSQIHQEQSAYLPQLLSERNQEVHNTISNNQDDFYHYEIGDHIAYRYEIVHSINKGAFGEVLKVFDHKASEYLALKIIRKCPELIPQTLVEISILTHISEKDRQQMSGVVHIKDFTIFRKHICIFQQLLEGNLFELISARNYQGLADHQIRLFAVQLLNSLEFLRKEKIIHCDLKPENIALKKWGKSGIKILDFGTSCFEGKQIYQYLQSRYYRAPEIIMGTGYSFPIDMWSLGCILAELKLGEPIFAGNNDLQQLMYIANSIGLPKAEDGQTSSSFLSSDQIKELIEQDYLGQYRQIANSQDIQRHPIFSKFRYIKQSMKTFQKRIQQSSPRDQSKFISFLQKILVWEPNKRISPSVALKQSWIMDGLPVQMKKMFNQIGKIQRGKSKKKSKSKQRSRSGHNFRQSSGKEKKESKNHNTKKSKSKQIQNIAGKNRKEFAFNNKMKTSKKLSPQRTLFFEKKLKGIIH